MTTRRVTLNGLSYNLIDEGEGTPVLLLHGFPDTGALWVNQIPALKRAGFRCLAPDLRGRGETDMPAKVDDYAIHKSVEDLVALLDAEGIERAHVVGHDWGAITSWLFALSQNDRVDHLVAISVGCPGAAQRSAAQLMRFWYMFVFQFEGIAEEAIQRHDWAMLRAWGGLGAPDIDRTIEDLKRPGRLTAGLNWYRAGAKPEILLADAIAWPTIKTPTMGIWSTNDLALLEEQMTVSQKVAENWRYERIEGAGHWIPTERPEHLNQLLLDFLPVRNRS